MAIQLRVPQLDEGNLQGGGQVMQTTGLAPLSKGLYIPEINSYAGVQSAAKQMGGFTDALLKFAVEQEKMKQQAEAQHGINEMREELSKAYIDYSMLEGKVAIDGYDDYLKRVNKIKQQTFDSYHRTKFIEQAVSSRGEELGSQFNQQGYAHQAKETVRWRDQETEALINQAASDALTHFNDPVLRAEAWDRWEKGKNIYLQNKGIDPSSDMAKAVEQKFRSNALSSLVEYAINTKQYKSAIDQLTEYKDKLNGDTYLKLYGQVKAHQIADAEAAARHAQVLRNQEISNTMQAITMFKQSGDYSGILSAGKNLDRLLVGNNSPLAKAQRNYAKTSAQEVYFDVYDHSSLDEKTQLAPQLLDEIDYSTNNGSMDIMRGLRLTQRITASLAESYDKRDKEKAQQIREIEKQYSLAINDGDMTSASLLFNNLKEVVGDSQNIVEQSKVKHAGYQVMDYKIKSFESLTDDNKLKVSQSLLDDLEKARADKRYDDSQIVVWQNKILKQYEKIVKTRDKEAQTEFNNLHQAYKNAVKNKDFEGAQKILGAIEKNIQRPLSTVEQVAVRNVAYSEVESKVQSFLNAPRFLQEQGYETIVSMIRGAEKDGLITQEQAEFHLGQITKIQEQNEVERGLKGMTATERNITMNQIFKDVAIDAYKEKTGIDIRDPLLRNKFKDDFTKFLEENQSQILATAQDAVYRQNEILKANSKIETMAVGKALAIAEGTPYDKTLSTTDNINKNKEFAESLSPLSESQKNYVIEIWRNKHVKDSVVTNQNNFAKLKDEINNGQIVDENQLRYCADKSDISQEDTQKLFVILSAKQGERFSNDYKKYIKNYKDFLESHYKPEEIRENLGLRNIIDAQVSEFQLLLNRGLDNNMKLDVAAMKAIAAIDNKVNGDHKKFLNNEGEKYNSAVGVLSTQSDIDILNNFLNLK